MRTQGSGWRWAMHAWVTGYALAVMAFLSACTLVAQGKATEAVLYSFKGSSHGANPSGGVVRDSAGNLYGTTKNGGAYGMGAVYKLDPAGHETILYSFTGGADGYNPYGSPEPGVIGDSAGNLYGTALGGTPGFGVVYKLDPTGHLTVLYSFTGGADGAYPSAVIRDSAGNLYGTTAFGGITAGTCARSLGCGVVFKLDATGHETVLYSFTGGADGVFPTAAVIRDSAGNLYGTTSNGGITAGTCALYTGCGVVFKLDATGHYTVLYSFTGGADGGLHAGSLVRDAAGSLYGTTSLGGLTGGICGSDGCGVVYKLDALGHETVLYSFTGGADGAYPSAGLIRDSAGNLYGTTPITNGICHSACDPIGGTVFKLDTTGHFTVVYSFPTTTWSHGGYPQSRLTRDSAGNLYGTADGGFITNGACAGYGCGVVFKVDPTGGETVLYRFPAEAENPQAGIISDPAGNLYGTTAYGGPAISGVVFKLDSLGNATVLHNFTGPDGAFPFGPLMRDSANNLYGTTYAGGNGTICGPRAHGCGVVFKLDASGNETVLHSFTGGSDGSQPAAGLIGDPAGNLYGTTFNGGSSGAGVVFKIDSAGQETVLYAFTGGLDGRSPRAGVIRDSAGNLYGTTFKGGPANANAGTVFKLDTTGHETVLHTFTGGSDGGFPEAGVILDSAGNLYGTTFNGGSIANDGVVYKIDTAGQETILYTFTGGADGANPFGSLVLDSAGNLYGTTALGGTSHRGVVFKLDATGHQTVLYTFTGSDGAFPTGTLIFDSAGNLYGTTINGGQANAGAVYKLTP